MSSEREEYMRGLSKAFDQEIRNNVARCARRAKRELKMPTRLALRLAEFIVLGELNAVARANFWGRT